MTASASAQSATLLASGPTESSVGDSGNAPASGTRRAVGLKPTTPLSAAGMRMEPPVSEPMAISLVPSPAETPAPEDEPPGMRAGSAALPGVPKCGLVPTAVKANSVIAVLPTMTAPARRRRWTIERVARGRRGVAADGRAGQSGLAGDVEQVLDRDDLAVQRAERHAGLAAGIGGIGRRPGGLGIEPCEDALLVGAGRQARQNGFETVAVGLHGSPSLLRSGAVG